MVAHAVHSAFLPPQHNHARCAENAVQILRDAFKHHGLSLTPLREEVFRAIAASHRCVGAYEVRDMLIAKGRQVPPISVYRAIRTLMQAGVVRLFESENACYASSGNDPASPRIVLACQQCGCIGDARWRGGVRCAQARSRLALICAKGRRRRGARYLRTLCEGRPGWVAVASFAARCLSEQDLSCKAAPTRVDFGAMRASFPHLVGSCEQPARSYVAGARQEKINGRKCARVGFSRSAISDF
jgi:Fur family transcriptional regulator, zinc uptake regulator